MEVFLVYPQSQLLKALFKRIPKKIITGSFFVLLGKVASNGLSFLLFLILARTFDVEEIGIYTFLVGIATMLSVVANWGTNEYLLRQGAAVPGELNRLLFFSQTIRALLGLVAGLGVVIFLFWWQKPASYVVTFLVILLLILVESQSIAYVMAFRSRENTVFEAWFLTVRNSVRLAVVYWLCSWNKSFLEVMLVLLVVSAAGLWVAHQSFIKIVGVMGSKGFSFGSFWGNFKAAGRFALIPIIGVGYSKADQIMLGLMGTDHQVGIYGAAFQIYQIVLFVPAALNVALLPKLVNLFENDMMKWTKTVVLAYKWLLFMGFILGVVMYFVAPFILVVFLGQNYIEAQPIIKVLMAAFTFTFVWASGLMAALLSANETWMINLIIISTLLLNVMANMLFIPRYGPMGAAYANLLSEGLAFSLGTGWLIRKRLALAVLV